MANMIETKLAELGVALPDAPAPAANYVPYVISGDLIFVSGTLGTLPDSFDLASGGTAAETKQTLLNIEKILSVAGADLGDIVKVSVYLADMDTFREMNRAYSEFFDGSPPARITVGGAELALGAAVEIECVARHVP